MAAGDILEEEEEEEEGPGPGNCDDDSGNTEADERELSGNRVRGRLAAQLSAPAELPACLSEHDYM